MKKLLLCLIILAMPLMAEEIWLGLVSGVQGDSLILVDNLKIHVPNIAFAQYLSEDDHVLDNVEITFPYKASLIVPNRSDSDPASRIDSETSFPIIKIHKFYDVKDGRLVERKID
jgi:hypothetical protein